MIKHHVKASMSDSKGPSPSEAQTLDSSGAVTNAETTARLMTPKHSKYSNPSSDGCR